MVTRTQATRLPDTDPSLMSSIEKLENRQQNFWTWSFFVNEVLSQFNLEDLINSTIPSLADDDSSYDRWRRLSKKVGDWLKFQIHPSIVAELRFSPNPIVYTDEIYKATTKIVVGRDAVFTWRSAIFMKREDYHTVE